MQVRPDGKDALLMETNDTVECPGCGSPITDLNEYDFNPVELLEVDCDCGRVLVVRRDVCVTYTARVKE